MTMNDLSNPYVIKTLHCSIMFYMVGTAYLAGSRLKL